MSWHGPRWESKLGSMRLTFAYEIGVGSIVLFHSSWSYAIVVGFHSSLEQHGPDLCPSMAARMMASSIIFGVQALSLMNLASSLGAALSLLACSQIGPLGDSGICFFDGIQGYVDTLEVGTELVMKVSL